MNAKVSYFDQSFENSIEYNNATRKYFNSNGQGTSTGTEFSLTSNPYKNIQFIRLEYSQLQTKDASGNPLKRKPEYQVTLSTSLKFNHGPSKEVSLFFAEYTSSS